MSPPAEQLIRDYLNRLSVAARGQLSPDDRRALTTRTRDFIERKTGLAGPPTAVEVAKLLSGLGDPAGLVSQEVRRLAVLRGEDVSEPVGQNGFLARVLRRDPAAPASWHWPSQPGSRTDLQLRLMDSAAAAAADSAQLAAPEEPSVLVPAQPAGQDRPAPRLTIVPAPEPAEAPGHESTSAPLAGKPRWPPDEPGAGDETPEAGDETPEAGDETPKPAIRPRQSHAPPVLASGSGR